MNPKIDDLYTGLFWGILLSIPFWILIFKLIILFHPHVG
jgi:hypothetical protein